MCIDMTCVLTRHRHFSLSRLRCAVNHVSTRSAQALCTYRLFRRVLQGPFVVAVVVFIAACGSGLVSDPTSAADLATAKTSTTQSESTYIQLSPSPALTPITNPSPGPQVRTELSTAVKSSPRPTVLDQARVLVDSAGREVKVPQQVNSLF